MDNPEIAKKANKILREYGIDSPPVPVEDIAAGLGIRVLEEALPEDISGVLDLRESGKPCIFINKAHNKNRQRFSIAHEIGHFTLRKPLGVHVDKQTFFRSAKIPEPLEADEIRANKFAAALLMPEYLISPRLEDLSDWLDQEEDIIETLAEDFGVSITAMSYRLQNLGYLPK
jgi:Zn-dependent peptidase ImmA (M78 family)